MWLEGALIRILLYSYLMKCTCSEVTCLECPISDTEDEIDDGSTVGWVELIHTHSQLILEGQEVMSICEGEFLNPILVLDMGVGDSHLSGITEVHIVPCGDLFTCVWDCLPVVGVSISIEVGVGVGHKA